MLKEIKKTIEKYRLIDKNDKILVAVSGGPDSVALLYALNSLRKDFNLKLHIGHLDHMLRKDSAHDKAFVLNLANRLKIPVTAESINVKKLAPKSSLEEVAREARLDFLFRAAAKIKADKIALGHNLDDQAETVLMRIIRGTGLYGLNGILPKRNICGYVLIRPLIEVKRSDINKFLKAKGITPCLDKSNLEDLYFRNKIRNQLIPFIEKKYNKNIKEVLSNMSENTAYDYDYLNKAALRQMRHFKRNINLAKFTKLHPALQRLVLRLNIARLQGNTRRITFRHMLELQDLIANRPVKSIVHLPKGLFVVKKAKSIQFYYKKSQ